LTPTDGEHGRVDCGRLLLVGAGRGCSTEKGRHGRSASPRRNCTPGRCCRRRSPDRGPGRLGLLAGRHPRQDLPQDLRDWGRRPSTKWTVIPLNLSPHPPPSLPPVLFHCANVRSV
jgi:hypothetical protein